MVGTILGRGVVCLERLKYHTPMILPPYLQSILYVTLIELGLLELFRLVLLFAFGDLKMIAQKPIDLLKAFIVGTCVDLKILAFINVVPLIFAILVFSFHSTTFFYVTHYFLMAYYFIALTVLSIVSMMNIGFYAYFKHHINYLIFGFFDDDTKALIDTIKKSYNLPLLFFGMILYEAGLFFAVKFALALPAENIAFMIKSELFFTFIFSLFTLFFICVRLKTCVSTNEFINQLATNGVLTYFKALKQRRENKKGAYHLAKKCGFSDNVSQALKITTQNERCSDNIVEAITQHTSKNESASCRDRHDGKFCCTSLVIARPGS